MFGASSERGWTNDRDNLLIAILTGQVAVVWAIFELKWSFKAWTGTWGVNSLPASDYHAKEIWKTPQEVAHMMAVDRQRGRDAS
jgi:hypothetical protein